MKKKIKKIIGAIKCKTVNYEHIPCVFNNYCPFCGDKVIFYDADVELPFFHKLEELKKAGILDEVGRLLINKT